jgi:hypothetical protein
MSCEECCRFGHKMYACDPLSYIGDKCRCSPCVNVRLCGFWGTHLSPQSLCPVCVSIRGGKLTFIDRNSEACPICLEGSMPLAVKHPSGCAHVFCVPCVYKIYFPLCPGVAEPSEYGFSPYADCGNHERPETVLYTHDTHRKVCIPELERWKTSRPDEFEKWIDATNRIARNVMNELPDRSNPHKCPLCRKFADDTDLHL